MLSSVAVMWVNQALLARNWTKCRIKNIEVVLLLCGSHLSQVLWGFPKAWKECRSLAGFRPHWRWHMKESSPSLFTAKLDWQFGLVSCPALFSLGWKEVSIFYCPLQILFFQVRMENVCVLGENVVVEVIFLPFLIPLIIYLRHFNQVLIRFISPPYQ